MVKRGKSDNEFVFLPLGGVGEIGMNCALYGFGPEHHRQWIMVDCGITFANEMDEPGVDVIYPDISFIEAETENLLGIIITHAHEDHFGALLTLYPKLNAPLYMTPFAAGLLEAKAASEPGAPKIVPREIKAGSRLTMGPFEIECLPAAHSIPESLSLAIKTPLGTALHTGDWKIDETPVVGYVTDFNRLTALGDEGVLALICDSTNVVREGQSPSEADVARSITEIVAKAKNRVALTTFSSNIARIRAVAEAAVANGREVVVMGRAMRRAIDVARGLGYFDGLPNFLDDDAFGYLPRNKVVALMTGSQGEPRAALARIANDDHRQVAISKGDMVIFSSRTIPGNEKAVGQVVNGLANKGIEIVTDRDALVHVSGHPRRGELVRMYQAVRPRIAIPVHGEPLHLTTHARFAADQGVPQVIEAKNGTIVRLAPDPAEIIDEAFVGRVFRDGTLVVKPEASGVAARRKASFAGVVVVAIVIDGKGGMPVDPEVSLIGLPEADRDGVLFQDRVEDAVDGVWDSLPKAKRRDLETVREAMKKAVRAEVNMRWGKKPIVDVVILEL